MLKRILCVATVYLCSLNSVANIGSTPPSPHPNYSTELTISSYNKRLPGLFYGAKGAGPHPTVILLHGYPGNEKNLDIAQGLRAAGWNVIFFHYRGAWGAEGEFSFMNAEADVTSVTKFLQQPTIREKYKIDTKNISYVGHSMGGHMAVAGITDNPEVNCAVVYDGANLGKVFAGDTPEIEAKWTEYGDRQFMLNGWSGSKAMAETRNYAKELNLLNRAAQIGKRPILFIPADSEVIPIIQIKELVAAMQSVEGNQVKYKLIKDDHSFNNSRAELLSVTRQFLDTYCR